MDKKQHSSVFELWNNFVLSHPKFKNTTIPESYYFCDNKKDADECAQLVVDGVKRATSTSMWWFETNKHADHVYRQAITVYKTINLMLISFF